MTRLSSVRSVFAAFLRLGLTSFGGPVAHLGYFRTEFVERRNWLGDKAYGDVVALCQFLPGPASSQTGMAIGILRAGPMGALAAWTGFTLPSAAALVAFAYGVNALGSLSSSAWLHGLKIVAVAVVANAVWSMARSLCPDRERMTLAIAAAVLTMAVPTSQGQIGAIVLGGLVGWLVLPRGPTPRGDSLLVPVSRITSAVCLLSFFVLLVGLPIAVSEYGDQSLRLFDSFYRSGSFVFGGGHVVLPLLQKEVVPPGWVTNNTFLAGYGAAQAAPGPLFSFAAYLGVAMRPSPNGWIGGIICLIAIYLPSFLLVIGVLPHWNALRQRASVQSVLAGVNAAVVGLLLSALYSPVWTSAIFTPADFGLGVAALLLLAVWKVPPWLVVVLGAAAAAVLAKLAGPSTLAPTLSQL